jgi:hypothetical protein
MKTGGSMAKMNARSTLEEIKKWLQERLENGVDCPCCGQFAKIYKRKLNSSMARGLIVLVKLNRRDPIHIPSVFTEYRVCASNDGALLRHWNLIEEVPGVRDDGSARVGYYLVTDLGRKFVAGKVRVPAYAYIYNSKLLHLDDEETVNIREALGERFHYEELMNAKIVRTWGHNEMRKA